MKCFKDKTWRYATWPGRQSDTNQLIAILGDGFAAAGAELIDVSAPWLDPPQNVDALLIHWPEDVFWATRGRLQSLRIRKRLLGLSRWRRRGIPIVWVVHNRQPHPSERTPAWNRFIRRLCTHVDGALTLSPSTVDEVRRDFPGLRSKPAGYFLHPRYPGVARSNDVRAAARAELEIPEDAHVVAQIGSIAAYKGAEKLVHAVRRSPRKNLFLLIAGKPTVGGYVDIGAPLDGKRPESPESVLDSVREAIGEDPRIRLIAGWLSPDQVASYTAAADLVALPFGGHLHSGSLIYTLSAGRPVLTPPQPFSLDMADMVGSDWVRNYDGPLTYETIHDALAVKPARPGPTLDQFEPDVVVRRVISFVDGLRQRADP